MIFDIIWRSFYVSSLGVIFGFVLAMPLAYLSARREFWGKSFLIVAMQALMALPPVVVGLGLYMLFRPQALFGGLGWLYSAKIMVVAQFVLVFPIIFSLAHDEFQAIHARLRNFFLSYPPSRSLEFKIYMREARLALATILLVAFGRALGEVGAVLIVGGSIARRTQVMTTVIIEETSKGNLDFAIKIGLILLVLALAVSAAGMILRRMWQGGARG